MLCEVWWADVDQPTEGLETLLDAAELRRLAAHRRDVDRRRSLIGSSLLRLAAAGLGGCSPREVTVVRHCRSCGGPHGKPMLRTPDRNIEASVSHGGDLIGVAVSEHAPVGLDVEPVHQALPLADLEDRVLTAAEREDAAWSPANRGAHGLLRCWVRKEALLKASGVGLSVPMTDLVVSPAAGPPALVSAGTASRLGPDVYLTDLRARRGHLACLAVLGAAPVVRELDAAPLLGSRARRGAGHV